MSKYHFGSECKLTWFGVSIQSFPLEMYWYSCVFIAKETIPPGQQSPSKYFKKNIIVLPEKQFFSSRNGPLLRSEAEMIMEVQNVLPSSFSCDTVIDTFFFQDRYFFPRYMRNSNFSDQPGLQRVGFSFCWLAIWRMTSAFLQTGIVTVFLFCLSSFSSGMAPIFKKKADQSSLSCGCLFYSHLKVTDFKVLWMQLHIFLPFFCKRKQLIFSID